jgi:tetratricopeptide (TPR) repeat protein
VRLSLIGVALAIAACGGELSVARVVDGRTIEGRFVAPEAYEAMLAGSLSLAEGRPADAVAAFERATQLDPSDALPWLRLAEARCRVNVQDARIERDLREARERDPSLRPVRRDGSCSFDVVADGLRGRDARERWAAAIASNDEPEELSRASEVSRLSCASHPRLAARVVALATAGRLALARGVSAVLVDASQSCATHVSNALVARLAVDEALARADVDAALRRSSLARVPASVVAARASLLGRDDLARSMVRPLLAADPDDLDARLVALAVGAASLPLPARGDALARVAPEVTLVFVGALADAGAKLHESWPAPAAYDSNDALCALEHLRLARVGVLARR